MEETIYLNQDGVLVSNVKLDMGGDIYASPMLTSVKVEKETQGCGFYFMFLVSLALTVAGALWVFFLYSAFGEFSEATSWGLVPLLGGAAGSVLGFIILISPRYFVTVVNAGGEVNVLRSRNKYWAEKVKNAIAQAIFDQAKNKGLS